ncbi:MAG TPA: flavin reductase family protein [Abditibacteriaceae bacterium]|jgi:flavin reductase (DIM6/NTAB) family NADH-FMN oxidoreductase RutF
MHLDFSSLAPRDRYKLLTSLVVPRPIALVTSLNLDGGVNAAPFSFFNCMGSDPAIVVLGVGDHTPDVPKDTAHNIKRAGEFVVNLVDENMADAMNICATHFPTGESEVEAAKLELAPSQQIQTPRLATAPASFECCEHSRLEIGRNRIIIGEVLGLHIRDDLLNTEKLYVDTSGLHLIGRMGGAGGYTRTRDSFEIPRLSYEQWKSRSEKEQD